MNLPDPREHWKLILGAAAALVLAAIIISVIIGLIRGNRVRRELEAAEPEQEILFSLEALEQFSIERDGLMIPDAIDSFLRGLYRPLNPRRRQWTLEEMKQFYFDPREIGTENLRQLNSDQMKRLLEPYR